MTQGDTEERFYLDANTIIAIIERNRPFTPSQRAFMSGIDAGRVVAMSSDIALAECLVGPLRNGDRDAVESILEFFDDRPTFPVMTMSRSVMIKAAEIRALTLAKLPDALHIACAFIAGCTVVVSADKRLRMPRTMRRIAFDDLIFS